MHAQFGGKDNPVQDSIRIGYDGYAVDDEHGDLVSFFRFTKLPHHTVEI